MSNNRQLLLEKIYEKTDGHCHICHRKLSFQNHGERGYKGAWHIDHSVPKARGGTDHLNNLFPACIDCNIEKATSSSRHARGVYGNTRAPYSRKKKERIKESNTTTGLAVGGGIGLALAGPIGMIIGASIGGIIGNSNSPKK